LQEKLVLLPTSAACNVAFVTINQRIKRRREALKISQAGLARLMGVSTQSVQQWESNGPDRTTPRRTKRAKLATVLKTTEDWLEFGDTPARSATPPRAAEDRLLYAPPSADAVEIALAWDQLSEARKEIYRSLIFYDAVVSKVMPPWFKFGTPTSTRYADLMRSIEKDMEENKRQLKLKLDV
jgi:transcriptional regulator with XRE-family HTH domain